MNKIDVLELARNRLLKEYQLSPQEAESAIQLLNVLIEVVERNSDPESTNGQIQKLAGDLIQNYSLLSALRQQANELDALKKLSLNLTSSLDLETVLNAVATEAMHLVKNANMVSIFLYQDKKIEFGAALALNGSNRPIKAQPRKNALTETVIRGGEQIVIQDMSLHPFYAGSSGEWSGSIIGIPLKVNHDVVGVMNLSRSTVGGFLPSELRLLGLLADQAAVAISNARLHQMVSRQAYSDTVTGLPNRRALDERLEKEVINARRTGYTFAVIMIDLDGFKTVNDTYGHDVGDSVLFAFFNYLATCIRTTDFLARYGGDELTLILSQTDPSSARIVIEKIIESARKFSFVAPNKERISLSLSSGVAIYPIHAITPADLIRAADEALYRAKKRQRGSYVIARGFTGELHHEVD